ncbi:MAG: hypothetical protein QXF45_08090 [Candidatus Caldarchaeum sp.]
MEEIYEKLLELWNQERTDEKMQAIPDNFFEELSSYVGKLRRQIRLSEKDSPNTLVKNKEIEMITRLLESFLRIRFYKLMEAALEQRSVENMLPFEKKTFAAITQTLSQHEDKIKNSLSSPKLLMTEEEEKLELVVFLQDFPKFVGEDLRSYGPFKEGDVTTIHYANAQALSKKKIVRPVKLI